MPFPLLATLIPAIAGAGASVTGALLGRSQQNKANEMQQRNSDRMFQMGDMERQRRDELTRMFLPFLLKSMGVSGPRIGGMMPQYLRPPQQDMMQRTQPPLMREEYL